MNMQIAITASPVFHLPFSLSELRLLTKMADTHYDGVCRAVGKAGPGGFIWGWSGRLVALEAEPGYVEGSARFEASSKEVDLLLKVLENIGGLSIEECKVARRLSLNLIEAARYASDVVPAWKTVFGGLSV